MKIRTFALAAIALCTMSVTASGAEPDYTRRPILMVHGYFPVNAADWVTWGRFKDKLIEDGWPEDYIMAPQFEDTTGCDPDHAREISDWVDELIEKTGWDKVDIIAHSEGGLNTMYYLRYFCGVNKVRNFVGLAIAVHGTRVACVDFVSCGADEMCIPAEDKGGWQANETLAAVNACDETLGDVRYTSIWSDKDEIIIPQEGSKLYGARNIQMKTFSEHGLIFLLDESLGYIKDALKNKTGYNTDGPGWDCIPYCVPPETVDTVEAAEAETAEVVEPVVEEPAVDDLATADETRRDVIDADAGRENDGFIIVPYDAGHTDRGGMAGDESTPADGVRQDAAATDDQGAPIPDKKGGCNASGTGSPWLPLGLLALSLTLFGIWRRRQDA